MIIFFPRCLLCVTCDASVVNGNGAPNLCVWVGYFTATRYLEALFHDILANITEREKAKPHACQGLLQLKTHSLLNVVTTSCCAAVTIVWVCLLVVGCTAIPGGGGSGMACFRLKKRSCHSALTDHNNDGDPRCRFPPPFLPNELRIKVFFLLFFLFFYRSILINITTVIRFIINIIYQLVFFYYY